MAPKMKTKVCSDLALGVFLLSCSDIAIGSEKLAKEINGMRQPKCNECHEPLTDEEIKEREAEGLSLKDPDIICDDCWADFIAQKYEEQKHPDDK